MNESIINATPVLDRERCIIGYEVRLQPTAANRRQVGQELAASAVVLANLLSDIGAAWLREGKLIFLHVSPAILKDQDFIGLLPEARIVLRLIGKPVIDQEFLETCLAVRKKKIGLCLDSQSLALRNDTLFKLASHFELDAAATDPETLVLQLNEFKKYQGKVIVKGIEIGKTFWFCHEMGFDYFQGPFLRRPEVVKNKGMSPSQGNLIELLNLLTQNADVKKLEGVFKHDPALIVKLINYVNCAALSGGGKIKSIANAITLIGYTQLYRWVALLVYTSDDKSSSPAVIRGLLTRSRFLELLGTLKYPGERHEDLFIIGMLSMLDQMFDTPMEKLIEKLDVPDSIVEALIGRQGRYGPFLALAEAYENEDAEQVTLLVESLAIGLDGLGKARLDAISWAEAIELPGA